MPFSPIAPPGLSDQFCVADSTTCTTASVAIAWNTPRSRANGTARIAAAAVASTVPNTAAAQPGQPGRAASTAAA